MAENSPNLVTLSAAPLKMNLLPPCSSLQTNIGFVFLKIVIIPGCVMSSDQSAPLCLWQGDQIGRMSDCLLMDIFFENYKSSPKFPQSRINFDKEWGG
jgi:hypothetical protein